MISWKTKKQKKNDCMVSFNGVWKMPSRPYLCLVIEISASPFDWEFSQLTFEIFFNLFFSSVVSSLCADLNRLSLCKNPTRRCTEQTDLLGKVKATSRKIGFEIARNTDINGSPNKFFHCYWDREIHQTWFIRDYFHCCRRRKLCCSPGTVEEKAKIGERSPYFELISIWLNTDAFVSTVEYFSPWWNQFSGVFLQDCLSAYDSHL